MTRPLSAWLYLGFLGLVGLQRLAELAVSNRHAERALRQGAVEVGRGQLLPMALLHAGFLVGCGWEVLALGRPFPPIAGLIGMLLFVAAELLRAWAIDTLGDRWTVRIIVYPDERFFEMGPITRGPYRFLRHPNYLAVTVELIAIALLHAAWLSLVAFSLLNALFLAVRIPTEERALGARWAAAFGAGGRP